MTNALVKSFGSQLDFLKYYLDTNYNWESPASAFARYAFHLTNSTPPFQVVTNEVINSLEPRRLHHQAPVLAAVGYELACGRVFADSILEAWANGLMRLASRDVFPLDRASFFYRPVELLGISLGVSYCSKVRPEDLLWLQEVLTKGEQKLFDSELWAFFLSFYAAKTLFVPWKPRRNLPLPEEMSIHELGLVSFICAFDSSLAQILGFNQLHNEIDKALLSICLVASVPADDTSHAAVLYLSLQKTITKVFQVSWDDYWQFNYHTKQLVTLVKFLCDRFRLANGQFESLDSEVDITDEHNLKELLDSLLQLRTNIDILIGKVRDTMRHKLNNQVINNQEIIITATNVTMSNNQNKNYVEIMSERKINIDQSRASIGIGYSENADANQLGGTINNYASEQKQNLAEAAAEIQALLQQLEKTYPTDTATGQMVIATKAIERIENDPNWKKRVVSAAKEGGLQAFEKAIDNPLGAFIVGAIKGWQETGAD